MTFWGKLVQEKQRGGVTGWQCKGDLYLFLFVLQNDVMYATLSNDGYEMRQLVKSFDRCTVEMIWHASSDF